MNLILPIVVKEVLVPVIETLSLEEAKLVVESLESSAFIIERDGWTQKSFHGAMGEVCVSQSIVRGVVQRLGFKKVMDDSSIIELTSEVFSQSLGSRTVGFPTGNLIYWNDEDGRTKQEVLDKLHSVAKEVRIHHGF